MHEPQRLVEGLEGCLNSVDATVTEPAPFPVTICPPPCSVAALFHVYSYFKCNVWLNMLKNMLNRVFICDLCLCSTLASFSDMKSLLHSQQLLAFHHCRGQHLKFIPLHFPWQQIVMSSDAIMNQHVPRLPQNKRRRAMGREIVYENIIIPTNDQYHEKGHYKGAQLHF